MEATNSGFVSEAFSKQSPVFDRLDEGNPLSAHLRKIFRKEVEKYLAPGSAMLELNCGTGIDALYFASKGHHVFATDNAPGMLEELSKKAGTTPSRGSLKHARLSYHDIDSLAPEKFDYIISNFGGLNCTDKLVSVLEKFSPLLNKG